MSDVVLEYNCFQFYKFIEALKKYQEEQVFYIDLNGLRLNFMDDSRIMLAEVTQRFDSFLEHNGDSIKMGVNLGDFAELLRTTKSGMKKVYLDFNKDDKEIGIRKYSPKLHNNINFVMETIDIDHEVIPMGNLKLINYDNKAIFQIKYLRDYLYNSGRLSDIVYFVIDDKGFHFKETGQCGKLDYLIDKEDCDECKGEVSNAYSLTFLNPLKSILEILEPENNISFSLKHDHPIRIDINIDSLGFDIVIFIAPRIEEADFDDDDEF